MSTVESVKGRSLAVDDYFEVLQIRSHEVEPMVAERLVIHLRHVQRTWEPLKFESIGAHGDERVVVPGIQGINRSVDCPFDVLSYGGRHGIREM